MTTQAPAQTTHPEPRPTPLTQPFWDGLQQGKVLLQYCRICDRSVWYPREFCPTCLTPDNPLEWIEASGKGRLHTYTIIRQAAHPFFQAQVPYIFGVVELNERARMMTNILCGIDDAKIGMPVEAVFTPISEQYTILQFRPS